MDLCVVSNCQNGTVCQHCSGLHNNCLLYLKKVTENGGSFVICIIVPSLKPVANLKGLVCKSSVIFCQLK